MTAIPPRPVKGWTVHNAKGKRLGVVASVRSDNRVNWHHDAHAHTVLSSGRWEDAPLGAYRPPVVVGADYQLLADLFPDPSC